MSNSNDNIKMQLQPIKPNESASVTPPEQIKAKRWSFIQTDLEKALDTWQELEKNVAPLSPDEEQFQKIKTIIEQLKSKLEQF